MMYRVILSVVVILSLGVSASDAGPWREVFQGLGYAATPTGTPAVRLTDGTRINGSRSGRLRIVPNGVFGKGYRLEFDRSFGPDTQGRPEVFRFGCLGDLTLAGNTEMTAGYNRCGDFLCGELEVIANNLGYQFRTKNGAQDIEYRGTLNVFNRIELNQAGFYTINMEVANNNSEVVVDGIVVRDEDDANYNVGPISIEGNLFFDAGVALLSGLGVDTTGLEDLFPKSPIDEITASISDQLQSANVVTNPTAKQNLSAALVGTLAGDEESAKVLSESLIAVSEDPSVGEDLSLGTPATAVVPEPGTFLIVLVGSTFAWATTRRR